MILAKREAPLKALADEQTGAAQMSTELKERLGALVEPEPKAWKTVKKSEL